MATFRTAKRVVWSEIRDLLQQLEALREIGVAPSLEHFDTLEASGWAEHRNTLAEALPDEAWRPLADFFRIVAVCRASVRNAGALNPLPAQLIALLPDAEATALAALYKLDTSEPVGPEYRAKSLRLPAPDAAQEADRDGPAG